MTPEALRELAATLRSGVEPSTAVEWENAEPWLSD
jgi:hypothetical protein